jgi:hypothetical protein
MRPRGALDKDDDLGEHRSRTQEELPPCYLPF